MNLEFLHDHFQNDFIRSVPWKSANPSSRHTVFATAFLPRLQGENGDIFVLDQLHVALTIANFQKAVGSNETTLLTLGISPAEAVIFSMLMGRVAINSKRPGTSRVIL